MNDEELVEVIARWMHLYDGGEGEDACWPLVEVDQNAYGEDARSLLAALRSAGFQVSPVEDRSSWVYCPICGRKNRPRDGSDDVTEVYCSPTNCEAWKVTATFDHESREWVPADSGGSG